MGEEMFFPDRNRMNGAEDRIGFPNQRTIAGVKAPYPVRFPFDRIVAAQIEPSVLACNRAARMDSVFNRRPEDLSILRLHRQSDAFRVGEAPGAF